MPPEQPQKRPAGDRKRRFPRPFGRYILEKTLSRGGMGEVFLAIVKHLEKRCVIKTIRGDLTGEEEFVGRFADEAKILVRAAHENIIRYFDAGRVAADYYIAMEYVHGRDLGDVLDRAYERGEPMPPEIGLYITANLLEGLEYAHELSDERGRRMGLVHRDISPQNVLIGFDGAVKLIDFGLARTDLLPNRTQGALAVGKYGYMSPEQARHEPLDGRADIYSAGVMLFEVFTGDRLVDEQDQSTLWQRVLNPKHRPPRSVLPSLPKEIDELVMRAVAVKPEDRFPSARAMADEVAKLRGKASTKEALTSYLRYLYPRVDFSAPPIPPLDNLAEGVHQSVIFATSREGARSVFGRGELPIEGTMQINAQDVREELNRRRRLEQRTDSSPRRGAPLRGPLPEDKANDTSAPAPMESTVNVVLPKASPDGLEATAARGTIPKDPAEEGRAEGPTQVGGYPVEDDEATAFIRAPKDLPEHEEAPLPKTAALGRAAMPSTIRDDEQTVMMSAPPPSVFDDSERSLHVFDPGTPAAPIYEEDSVSQEPTEFAAAAPMSMGFDEVTRPGRKQAGGPALPSIVPSPPFEPAEDGPPAEPVEDPAPERHPRGGALRARAIRERVRTEAREHRLRQERPSFAVYTSRGEAKQNVPPRPQDQGPARKEGDEGRPAPGPAPAPTGVSVYLLGGLIFSAAALVVMLVLALTS